MRSWLAPAVVKQMDPLGVLHSCTNKTLECPKCNGIFPVHAELVRSTVHAVKYRLHTVVYGIRYGF